MLHDYLHCLVFKEQSCLAFLSKCPSLQATHLSYRIQISLSRTFLISFFKFFEPSQRLASQGFATPFRVRVCQRLVLYYTSRNGLSTPFLKKSKKSWQIAVCRGVQFVVKVSCSYVVRGERGVLFLFPAKRPPQKNSCPVTCAGQANGAAFSVFA